MSVGRVLADGPQGVSPFGSANFKPDREADSQGFGFAHLHSDVSKSRPEFSARSVAATHSAWDRGIAGATPVALTNFSLPARTANSCSPTFSLAGQFSNKISHTDASHCCGRAPAPPEYPSHNYRLARPSRISWLLTGLINQGASVALLVTPQFFNTQSDYVNKSGWAAAQLMGRIEKYVSLPETLPVADLEKVARAWLPNGDKRSIEVLADFAALSQKYLAAIEHTVKQAIYLARQAGRETPDWTDIKPNPCSRS